MHFARETGLRYVCDRHIGYTRRRAGKGFIYFEERKRITCTKIIARIKTLAIPPAWQEVWICKYSNGHLQATGRDARGRKQYRYHSKWNEARNETKFSRLLEFGECLPKIRDQVERDLKLPGLPREKVLAAVVKVMELTRIRVGNDIYAEENDSYGLTTIRNNHADVTGHKIKFCFRGKSGVLHEVAFRDPRLSRIIQRCQDLPGEELFTYENEDGEACDVSSGDVNDYLRSITDRAISAKDFRTWGGTVKAVEELAALGESGTLSGRARKSRHCEVIKKVAAHLRNTVAICRKYYVHPAVFIADEDGYLHRAWSRRSGDAERVTLDILQR